MTHRPMTLSQLLMQSGLPGVDKAQGDLSIVDVVNDSRKVTPGALFVAVPGFESDGHQFIPQAIERGAVAVLAQKAVTNGTVPVIVVDDVRRVQADVARAFFDDPAQEMTIVGITGTNGKTTVACLLESIFQQAGVATGLVGTLVYRWPGHEINAGRTTPDSLDLFRLLARMRQDGVTALIMEVSSHALELKRVRGIEFDAAVFTNLSQDHLDFHKTMDAYAQTKSAMFTMLKPEGVGVINGDDGEAIRMKAAASAKTRLFGEGDGCELRIENVRLTPRGGRFVLSDAGELTTHLVGRFNVWNAAAAASAAWSLGVPADAIQRGLSGMEPVRGRMERVPSKADFEVFVDYAHTPDALRRILQTAREFTSGRVIVLFGCGGDRDRGKRPLMGRIAGEEAHQVVVTTDNPRTEDPGLIIDEILTGIEKSHPVTRVDDRRQAIETALNMARPGDTVILAGKGHETYQEIHGQRTPFDDAAVARNFLKEKGLA